MHKKPRGSSSVCWGFFIKPTKQFNSFVHESSTSLINKSRDIIFFSHSEKPEMSSLLKQIIPAVCGECSPSNLLSTIKYSGINIKENQRWGKIDSGEIGEVDPHTDSTNSSLLIKYATESLSIRFLPQREETV